jgi:hypothetical protein
MRLVILSVFLGLLGCSGGSSDTNPESNSDKPSVPSYVNWKSVTNDHNPEIEELEFSLLAAEKVDFDIYGFDKEVQLRYSSRLPENTVKLEIYKVSHGLARWGRVEGKTAEGKLSVQTYGTYACAISVKNSKIAGLDGGCVVRLVVTMPAESEVEVYTAGKLISQRYIPMSFVEFIENLEDATWDKDKYVIIDEFIQSYTGKNILNILAEDLALALSEFTFGEGKLEALRRLHEYVIDRRNLETVIEESFNSLDQDEAKEIVGLN